MPRNIFAYTAPGADYPEYVSLNERDDGKIILTARDKGGRNVAEVELPRGELLALFETLRTMFSAAE